MRALSVEKYLVCLCWCALVSTFVTTPLTQLVYPDSYRDGVRKSLSTPAEDDGAADGLDSEGVNKLKLTLNSIHWQMLANIELVN